MLKLKVYTTMHDQNWILQAAQARLELNYPTTSASQRLSYRCEVPLLDETLTSETLTYMGLVSLHQGPLYPVRLRVGTISSSCELWAHVAYPFTN